MLLATSFGNIYSIFGVKSTKDRRSRRNRSRRTRGTVRPRPQRNVGRRNPRRRNQQLTGRRTRGRNNARRNNVRRNNPRGRNRLLRRGRLNRNNRRFNPRSRVNRNNRPRNVRPNQNNVNPNQNRPDQYVISLIEDGIVARDRFLRLADGSYVMQVNSLLQSDGRISGLRAQNQRTPGGRQMEVFGGATCPAMAMRSAVHMLNYFLTNNPHHMLRIRDVNDARNFLIQMDNNNIQATNLHSAQIEEILNNNRLNFFGQNNENNEMVLAANANNVTVIDSVEFLNGGSLQDLFQNGPLRENIAVLRAMIETADDGFFHAFIVGTGTKGGGHWISVGVIKREGRLYWFVCDSGSANRIGLLRTLLNRILAS